MSTREKLTLPYSLFKLHLDKFVKVSKTAAVQVKVPSRNLSFDIPAGTGMTINSITFAGKEDLMCLVFQVQRGSNIVPMTTGDLHDLCREVDDGLPNLAHIVTADNLNMMVCSGGMIYAPYEFQIPEVDGKIQYHIMCEEIGPII